MRTAHGDTDDQDTRNDAWAEREEEQREQQELPAENDRRCGAHLNGERCYLREGHSRPHRGIKTNREWSEFS
jgi:hypothetical protein